MFDFQKSSIWFQTESNYLYLDVVKTGQISEVLIENSEEKVEKL